MTTTVESVWAKILEGQHRTGRSGSIPVYNGNEWRVFRNSQTIYAGAENAADPAKVDVLRQNVVDLLGHYPKTIPQLEKLGIRVRSLLNKRIETYEDVVVWAESIFNSGPVMRGPVHVGDTTALVYDDFKIEPRTGEYVIPAAPRGEGLMRVLDFSSLGAKKKEYGPRHDFTVTAFRRQLPPPVKKAPRYRGTTAEGEPLRPRGRPRKDGLMPGSKEARAADRKTERERKARQAARESKKDATITQLPTKRRRLVRVGEQRQEA